MWSDLSLSPSLKVKRRQPNVKIPRTLLLLILEDCNVKPTYRKSWAWNLLMWTDLALGPLFKLKQWSIGFGELSFRWIQICIGSPMHRFHLFLCVGMTESRQHHRGHQPFFGLNIEKK